MTQLVWPNGSTQEPPRSDGYGPRESIHTSAGWTRPFHAGTDHYGIGDLRAIGDGEVVDTSWVGWAGWQVIIYLGVIDGRKTWVRYCHLASRSPLKVGARVKRGDLVGREGATGQVVGTHLHWEVYRDRIDRGEWGHAGTTIDPRAFVRAHLTTQTPAEPEEEDDMMYPLYVQDAATKSRGTIYRVMQTGKKRPVPSAEWNAIRAQQTAGGKAGVSVPVLVAQISAADLKAIPNA